MLIVVLLTWIGGGEVAILPEKKRRVVCVASAAVLAINMLLAFFRLLAISGVVVAVIAPVRIPRLTLIGTCGTAAVLPGINGW